MRRVSPLLALPSKLLLAHSLKPFPLVLVTPLEPTLASQKIINLSPPLKDLNPQNSLLITCPTVAHTRVTVGIDIPVTVAVVGIPLDTLDTCPIAPDGDITDAFL